MKNTAPEKGDCGRRRNKGRVGKDMEWERREQWQQAGMGKKGQENSTGSEDRWKTVFAQDRLCP